MRLALISFGLISAAYLPAQQTSLSGPIEAITFDAPTRSLRAVFGFPGSASFGPALMDSLDFASVAPQQNYGIVFESGKCLFVSGLNSNKMSRAEIAGVTEYPDGIAWSADGSLAILYSFAGRWFQTVSGLPNSPVAGTRVDLSSLSGSFTSLAVDAAGKQIAVGMSGPTGAVYQTAAQTAGDQFTPVASLGEPVSLSFSTDAQTLYALDGASLEITAASLGGHGFQTLALPGILNPIAIQSVVDSQNHQLLYVAGGNDRLMRILDVASQQIVANISLNFQPTSLNPFGNGSFVLATRSRSASPLWLFSNTPVPAAYFVPAVQLQRPARETVAIGGRTR